MSQQQQQQLLKQDMTVSQILRTYGKQFRQIQNLYSDGVNGRCALGVIMSYYGWDGRADSDAAELLLAASIQMKHAVVDEGLLIDLNDSGYTFDEIADYLDRAEVFTITIITSGRETSHVFQYFRFCNNMTPISILVELL